jgi:hypothetical protein
MGLDWFNCLGGNMAACINYMTIKEKSGLAALFFYPVLF